MNRRAYPIGTILEDPPKDAEHSAYLRRSAMVNVQRRQARDREHFALEDSS
jgi:hypothetical protein